MLIVLERDIKPLFDERKEFLQEIVIDQAEVRSVFNESRIFNSVTYQSSIICNNCIT